MLDLENLKYQLYGKHELSATCNRGLKFPVNSRHVIVHAVKTNDACKAVWPDKCTEDAADLDVEENLFQ